MLGAALLTIAFVAVFADALGSSERGGLIARRPYNNRYNDATGARDGRFI